MVGPPEKRTTRLTSEIKKDNSYANAINRNTSSIDRTSRFRCITRIFHPILNTGDKAREVFHPILNTGDKAREVFDSRY